MEQAVRTFDNVTYDLPKTPCQVLVAMDCSPAEKFAVYASELNHQAKTKKITVLTAGHEIKLLPPQEKETIQVEVNGKMEELTQGKEQITLGSGRQATRIYLRKNDKVNSIAVIESPKDSLTVLYDGKNVKVMVGGEYQGKTCGICGNNDGESEKEFEGPSQCLYSEPEDFVRSYSMSGQHCAQVPQPQGKVRCPKDSRPAVDERNQLRIRTSVHSRRNPTGESTIINRRLNSPAAVNQQNPCQLMRTEFVVREDKVCFTTRPVLSCGRGCRSQSVKQVELDFHCLPKSSPFTQQLMGDAQKMPLTQLTNKRVDFREAVTVPMSCSPAA